MTRRAGAAPLIALLVLAACSSGVDSTAEPSDPSPTSVAASSTAPRCSVTPATVWVVEGELARATVDCAGAAVGALDLTVAPAGLRQVDDALEWVPAADQAGTYTVSLAGGGTALEWNVGVADGFDQADNVPVVNPATMTHEFGLEVIHLFTDDALSASYGDATMVHGGNSYDVDLRVRGALSLQYPKPNFTVRVEDGFRSTDPAFDGLDRLVLVAGFDDNSLVRNRLAQQLWADIDADHLIVAHDSVVLYLDGAYAGVYTLLENVNHQYLARHGLDAAGQLFKANDSRADFRLDVDATTGLEKDATDGFEKKSGAPEEGPAALGPIADLVEFVATADDTRFLDEVGEWVDVDDVVDWFVFVSHISAGDSANKNAYWYQPSQGGPFRYVPWDFNHSFGQDFLTTRIGPDDQLPASFVAMNGLFERLWTTPETRALIDSRTQELLAGPLHPARLGSSLDAIAAELGPNSTRNDQRWNADYDGFRLWSDREPGPTAEQEIAYIRAWIEDRHEAVAAGSAQP